MADSGVITVRAIAPEDTHDLRRRVLRQGVPDPRLDVPSDHVDGALHLGAFEGDRLVGAVSSYPAPTPFEGGGRSWQFRFMAVDHELQRGGIGRILMAELVDRARAAGVEVLWAHGRDSALGFYERMGFQVVGEGFVHLESGLPHHVVVLEL